MAVSAMKPQTANLETTGITVPEQAWPTSVRMGRQNNVCDGSTP
jgi:hypothetical protein